MPGFSKPGQTLRAPFGKNQYLRSTKGNKFDSATCAAGAVPAETIDGDLIKILQSGEVIAKITSGPFQGYVGPFQAAGVAEVQTATKAGTWTSGTYDHGILGITVEDVPMATTAAALQVLVDAALVADGQVPGQVVYSGGPLNTTPLVMTFHGTAGGNIAAATFDTTNIVGGGTVGNVETTQGTAGATDGRGDPDNIVGISETFGPWELNERDLDISVLYDGAVKQEWCFERNAAGVRIALTNTTRDAILANPSLAILFK